MARRRSASSRCRLRPTRSARLASLSSSVIAGSSTQQRRRKLERKHGAQKSRSPLKNEGKTGLRIFQKTFLAQVTRKRRHQLESRLLSTFHHPVWRTAESLTLPSSLSHFADDQPTTCGASL